MVAFFAALDRPELWLLWVPYGIYLARTDPAARKLVLSLFALVSGAVVPARALGLRATSSEGSPARRRRAPTAPRTPSAHSAPSSAITPGVCYSRASRSRRCWRPAAAAIGFVAGRARWRSQSGAARGSCSALGVVGFAWWVGCGDRDAGRLLGQRPLPGPRRGADCDRRRRRLGLGRERPGARMLRRGVSAGQPACSPRLLRRSQCSSRSRRRSSGGVIQHPRHPRVARYQARLREDLSKTVRVLGGPAPILRCGTVMTEGFQVPMVAWALGVHTAQVEAPPASSANPGAAPNVIFKRVRRGRRSALPVVQAWRNANYRLEAHVGTFRVYSSCRDRVALADGDRHRSLSRDPTDRRRRHPELVRAGSRRGSEWADRWWFCSRSRPTCGRGLSAESSGWTRRSRPVSRSHSVSAIPGILRHDGNPPLYYMLLHFWMRRVRHERVRHPLAVRCCSGSSRSRPGCGRAGRCSGGGRG